MSTINQDVDDMSDPDYPKWSELVTADGNFVDVVSQNGEYARFECVSKEHAEKLKVAILEHAVCLYKVRG